VLAELRALLSVDELERAERFYFPHLGREFTIAMGPPRSAHALLDTPADRIRFSTEENGKPAVREPSTNLQFNLSHSGELAAFAFSMDCEVGIDIEEIRPFPEMESVARQFFSPSEIDDLANAPAIDRLTAFFRCWTRKEAGLKATGEGLGADGDRSTAQLWQWHTFNPSPSHVGALAYQGVRRAMRIFSLATRKNCSAKNVFQLNCRRRG